MNIDECECGVPFADHFGIVEKCRKFSEMRAALLRLISASEFAVQCLTNEFGYSGVKANFQPLLDAIDAAKAAATEGGST